MSVNHSRQPSASGASADALEHVIGECARFGQRLQALTGQLGHAGVDNDGEGLRQAVLYVQGVLADLLTVVRPVDHQDLQRILHDRAAGRVRCAGGCRADRAERERHQPDAGSGAVVEVCTGCGGGVCVRCQHPIALGGPEVCRQCSSPPGRQGRIGEEPGARPREVVRDPAAVGDLPWVATA